MGALYGYLRMWAPYPDWFLRYDFAVKKSPKGAATSDDDPRQHCDKTGAPLLYYYGSDARKPGIFGVFSKPRTPYYFAAFAFRDDQRLHQVIRREDLVFAFEKLVGSWEDIYSTAINLTETYNRASDIFCREACAIHDRTFCHRVERMTERLMDLQERMHWAADFFGQYLDFLSDAEERRQLPRHWNRYPGRLISAPFLRKERHRTRITDNTIDDFVFSAARRINDSTTKHPKVKEARDAAVSLIEEMLEFTHTGQHEWHVYHPDRRIINQERRRLVEAELWWITQHLAYGVEDPVYAKKGSQVECCHCGGPVEMMTEVNGLPGVYHPPYVLINDKAFVPLLTSPFPPPDYAG